MVHTKLKALLVTGLLLAVITPALPALAADNAAANTTPVQTTPVITPDPTPTPTPPSVTPPPTPAPVTPPPTLTPDLTPTPVTPPPSTGTGSGSASAGGSQATQTTGNNVSVGNAFDTTSQTTVPATPGLPATNPSTTGQTAPNSTAKSTTGTNVANQLNSDATSGNADVAHNGMAGSAVTGNADATATLLNLLQSSLSFDGSTLTTFSKDIGTTTGDIYIDPRILGNATTIAKKPEDKLSVSSDATAGITNNINLSATSGGANVDHNVSAGNATTGDATALLNLVNIINSMAAAHQSFIGSINILGDFNGDILLPPDLMAALMATTGTPDPSTTPANQTANITNNDTIANNITQNATSGHANVDHNKTAGNATTGDTLNNLTVLNLTGRDIVGSDAILVIVNVMGHWVGMIMNSPAGSRTATLGDNSALPASATAGGISDLTIDNNAHITNNINLTAQSGDASVDHNTTAGNATSGKAITAVNLVNIINSKIAVSDWFGILFINVYGNWNGSFGVNTSAGEPPMSLGATTTVPPLVTFIPAPAPAAPLDATLPAPTTVTNTFTQDGGNNQKNASLGTNIDNGPITPASTGGINPFMLTAALGGLAAFGILGAIERKRKHYSRLDNQIIYPGFNFNAR
jgi:hypothetical protein